MKNKLFLILFTFIFSLNCFSQFSKTHYIPPLCGSSIVTSEDQYLYISTPSITKINFRIIELGGTTILGKVSRDEPYVYNVGFGNNTHLHVDASLSNTIFSNKGYVVEADDLVYVSARVTAGNGAQAGELVSKGLASLGNRFRIGAFTNVLLSNYDEKHTTFISVLATENNTIVNFSNLKTNVTPINSSTGNSPFSITLNSGQSYVLAVQGPNTANRNGLIGSLVTSDKPIALNCGSFGGSNAVGNLDLGFDQIVSAERTGTEYVFIKSTGVSEVEKVLLVADEDNTQIFINGSTIAIATINAGNYYEILGNVFNTDGNLYVQTSKKTFAYQSIGDNSSSDQRNQEMFFVPPLSCQTPRVIDNIPFIDYVGNRQFIGRVTLVTKTGSTLNFIINGVNYTLATLPFGVSVNGPTNVTGNADYETYVLTGVTGNVSVYSTGELYLAAYGSSGAATFGGFYSGFTFKPEVTFNQIDVLQSSCIPNTNLSVNTLSPFDTFQWYFNDLVIQNETNSTYTPTAPGYYYVSATIAGCSDPKDSDKIPVSTCPIDSDNDGVNNNNDLDNDNDGITNCTESYGNQNFNLTNTNGGSINSGNYTNAYTGAVSFSGTGIPSTNPIIGDANGNFVTEAAQGKENKINYTVSNFTNPISLAVEYASTALDSDLFTSSTEIRITCPVNKTLTVLNPDNQILIDTNYDGIFENGITEYSSFEIRFRLNSNIPLVAGTGTFSIRGNFINSILITNINLVNTSTSRVALRLLATCVPKDSDGDGIADQNDYDSDNDSITDLVEYQGTNVIALSNIDTNNDGIDDAFVTGTTPADNDSDSIPNYLDLDADNDGIHDLDESGSNATDLNNNGIIDGANFGVNGLANSLETSTDSGIVNYSLADTDTDGIFNYIELDSDNDLCNDVIEAGYLDSNGDGLLGGTVPPTFNPNNGMVTSGSGYGNPNANYTIGSPIAIVGQPVSVQVCQSLSASFTVNPTAADSYQWQISTDGGTTWTNLTNNANYFGTIAISMTVTNVTPATPNHQYRVVLNRIGNSCGLISSPATLTTYPLPIITTPISIVQCDVDTDGISAVNLTVKNPSISPNFVTDTFSYFTTQAAAQNNNPAFQINNPIAYTTSSTTVWVRVVNTDGCPIVGRIDVVVSATQISEATFQRNFAKCDDAIAGISSDFDGTSVFIFDTVTPEIQNLLPPPSSNYTITYYENLANAEAETFPINPANYRNTTPNVQQIYVRIDSNLDNQCYGLGNFVTLTVEPVPTANPVNPLNLIRQCDDNQDGIYGFNTSTIQAAVLNGQTGVNVQYFRSNGTALPSPLPNPFFVNSTETITIRVNNNTTQTGGTPCYDEITLQFIVDDFPEAFAIDPNLTSRCDDEPNPIDQDGFIDFDTTNFLNTILGTQTGMNVYYYDENNSIIPTTIPNQLPNPFKTGTQNVRVVVENPINTACNAQLIIPFVVRPTPKIDQEESIIICLPNTQALIDTGILDQTSTSNYSFQWYDNSAILNGQTNPTLTINSPGIYSVTVSNASNCSKTRTIAVTGSEIATLQNIDILDLSDINSILINYTGSGVYEFAIDDINGPYQDSNFFNNVPMGLHEIFVRDKNGCGTLGPLAATVLGIPHYFTPNGDGFHDYWNVKGANLLSNSKSVISIFDRFGKLLKQLSATSAGWDGTFNGNQLPADDYWYSIEFEDGRSAKGHFALKR